MIESTPTANAVARRMSWVATVSHIVSHALLLGGLVVFVVSVVPQFKRTFEDFKAAMPAPTISVITLSAWCNENVLLSAAIVGVAVLADSAMLIWLRHGLRRPLLGQLWSLLVLVSLGGLLGWGFNAMLQPYLQLMEGLSQ